MESQQWLNHLIIDIHFSYILIQLWISNYNWIMDIHYCIGVIMDVHTSIIGIHFF